VGEHWPLQAAAGQEGGVEVAARVQAQLLQLPPQQLPWVVQQQGVAVPAAEMGP
jgi:hypothetical protein